jgi:hypothetical protein
MPYMNMFNSLQALRDHSFPLRDTPVAMDTTTGIPDKGQGQTSPSVANSTHSVANMSEEDILNLTESSLLHIARSLIREKLPPSMYTPRVGVWNTSMEQEHKALSLRSRNPSDATLVDGDNQPTSSRPPWRNVFTPSEIYILYRALMFACHPTGSKAFFDEKRIAELSPSQKAVHERWAADESRDKRVSLAQWQQRRISDGIANSPDRHGTSNDFPYGGHSQQRTSRPARTRCSSATD